MDLIRMLSANEIVAQVISFLILLFLLRIFAWKKILAMLDERKARIASEFKQIDDAKLQVASLKSDLEAKLAKSDEIGNARVQEAVEAGRKITEDVRKKAHEEAQDIINKARENIKYELSAAKEELKEKIIDLTISATEAVVQEKLVQAGDKKLIKDFLEKLDEVK